MLVPNYVLNLKVDVEGKVVMRLVKGGTWFILPIVVSDNFKVSQRVRFGLT